MLLCSSYSNSQTIDPGLESTGNVLNLGTGLPWAGTVTGAAGGTSGGGNAAAYNPSTGNIIFGYTTQTVSQGIAINQALANAGTGIQLAGYKYSWGINNDLSNGGGNRGTLTGNVSLTGAGGNILESYNYNYSQENTGSGFKDFTGTQLFSNQYQLSAVDKLTVSFTGKDQNWWAGYWGPRVHVNDVSLLYTTNPCSSNPAYNPSCAGFNNIVTSGNLLNPDLMSNGNIVYNSFAINTALKSSGAGVDVYGFNYGYNYSLGNGTYGCTATNQDGSCSWYMNTNPTAEARVRLTNSSGNVIYSTVQSRSTPNTAENVSYQYLLPNTTNSLSLGTFTLGASTSGNAAIQNMYANVLYKPDPCVTNPLYSPTCPGYATAYAKNMILGSTVASASGPVVASASNSMSSNTGTVDQSNPQTQQTQQTQQQGQPTQQSSPSPQQDVNQNPSVAQDNPAQSNPQQAGPAPTQPQPAGGPPQTTTASAPQQSSGPSGGGGGPSKLAMSVVKSAQANDKATQQMAVQNAAKTLENATQSSQASSNMAISMNQDMSANSATTAANFASQTTQASSQVATQSSQVPQQTAQSSTPVQQTNRQVSQVQQQQQDIQQDLVQSTGVLQVQAPQQQETQQAQTQTSTSVVKLLQPQQQEQPIQSQMTASLIPLPQRTYTPPQQVQDTQSTQVVMLKPPTPPAVEIQQQANSGTGLTISRNMFAYNPLVSSNSSNMTMPQQQTQPMYQQRLDQKQFEVETPQIPIASFSGSRAGNPLSEIMTQQRFEMMQNNITQPGSSVNKNVQPNDLAVGVDLASMSIVPAGFNAYSIALKDSTFYEPKEVYKNQKTVDNERVLRGLTRGSDRLHQEMVDQQYKVGN